MQRLHPHWAFYFGLKEECDLFRNKLIYGIQDIREYVAQCMLMDTRLVTYLSRKHGNRKPSSEKKNFARVTGFSAEFPASTKVFHCVTRCGKNHTRLYLLPPIS